MKQCIKYFMIILLGVLLYDGAAQAAGISCTLISNDSERCFLSQAPTSHQQNIRNIYNHFSSMPLYMDNVDSTGARQQEFFHFAKLLPDVLAGRFAG